jgi:UDPglucose 6-dehydrogenase
MRISVIGCGSVGGVHAVSMPELGHEVVVGVDVDRHKVEALIRGRDRFLEPGYEELFTPGRGNG